MDYVCLNTHAMMVASNFISNIFNHIKRSYEVCDIYPLISPMPWLMTKNNIRSIFWDGHAALFSEFNNIDFNVVKPSIVK